MRSPPFSWRRDCSTREPKKEDSRDERREGRWAQIEINRHWLKEATRGSPKEDEKEEKEKKDKEGRRRKREDGHQWTPVGFRELTVPRRSSKETRYRTPSIAMRLLTRRSLISIPTGPVERSNSKKRDGWRHYERLRIVTVLDSQSAFSC